MSKNGSFVGTNFIYCRVLVMVMVMVVLVVMVVLQLFLLVVTLLQAQVVTRTNEGPNLVPPNPWGATNNSIWPSRLGRAALSEKEIRFLAANSLPLISTVNQRKESGLSLLLLIWQKEGSVHKKQPLGKRWECNK